MVSPVKTAGLWSYSLHTDDRNSCSVFVKFTQHLFGYQSFSLQSQCCLSDTRRPKHKNERIRFSPADRIHQCLFSFHKPRMRHRK